MALIEATNYYVVSKLEDDKEVLIVRNLQFLLNDVEMFYGKTLHS